MKKNMIRTSMRRRGSHESTRMYKADIYDIDGDIETVTTTVEENHSIKPSRAKTLMDYLDELQQKRETIRENALHSIIKILNNKNEDANLKKNFATVLYGILDCIKRGSAEERKLASHALGLLAMTFPDADTNAQELYKESLPSITVALSKTSKMLYPWTFISLLDSLAIVTFLCSNNTEETEAAMQIIWAFLVPKSKFDVSASKQVPEVISAAISAWSFLLTTIDGWELSHNHWQEAISQFLARLEADDKSVCIAAGEALATICDRQSFDKFSKDSKEAEDSSSQQNYSERKIQIKENILKELEKVSIRAKNQTSLKQTFNNAARADWDVLKYFKNDGFIQTSVRTNGQRLTLTSWSRMIQLKFLKNFVGEDEFGKHLLENELFHYMFEFTPINMKHSGPELYESTAEKIVPIVFLPEEKDHNVTTVKEQKQERLLRNSIINKAKTKVMNKNRKLAEERKRGMYHIESEL